VIEVPAAPPLPHSLAQIDGGVVSLRRKKEKKKGLF